MKHSPTLFAAVSFKYDVIVVGAGHAGCEAACAAARMGASTCLITMDMNKIAQMSCNPAMGGIAKGQIVREVDALGGQAGRITDLTTLQFRMLNRSKGPAMWSPRAQCDRARYIEEWRRTLDRTPGLHIWQDEAAEVIVEGHTIRGVRTVWGAEFTCRALIITAGTFLRGLMHVGRRQFSGGRSAEPAANHLSQSLEALGLTSQRMKTGTPVRIDKRSVHFDELEEEPGDERPRSFSFLSAPSRLKQLPCWTCYTNPRVHEVLRSGLADSPLYNGQIQSIGPRYCPSIETKLVTFADRERHPLFLEPEGEDTNEMYLNGFSSSLPMDVQIEALRQIPALRDVVVYRPGYAIEYDFFPPTQLQYTLETQRIDGLFLAGQVNGTTGYEEAAGQGVMAGINAALKCSGGGEFVLRRDEAYIGVLIDDLVTKGVDEPYRMFTSRAEFRILLRQDNADKRLTPYAERFGLASEARSQRFVMKQAATERIREVLKQTQVRPDEVENLLNSHATASLSRSCRVEELLLRPQISLQDLTSTLPSLAEALSPFAHDEEALEAVEIEVKYGGYIARERQQAEKMQRLEDIRIRGRFDYASLHEISTEGRQKLLAQNPQTLGQASRIPGVSPSDISVLLVLLGR